MDRANPFKLKLEILFVLFAAVFGVLTIVFSPPMSTPDENTHFYNAYTIADGQIFAQQEDGMPGKYIPQNVIDYITENDAEFKQSDSHYSFTDFYFDGALPASEESQQRVFKNYFGMNINQLGYLVQAAGMVFGKVVLSVFQPDYVLPNNLAMFGELFNLAFYILIVFFALRITPCFQRTMFLLALMPMSLYQASSLSYDAPLIALCMLLFAYTMRILADPGYQIGWRDVVVISVIAVFLCAVKQAYAPMMLILFAIPRTRFGSWKRYFGIIGIVVACGAVAYLVPALINSYLIPSETADYVLEQQAYVMSHLFEFPYIVLRTLWHEKGFYMEGFFGKLGQQDTNFPPMFIVLFYLLLLVTVFYDVCEAKMVRFPVKLLAAAGALIMIFGSFYQMYIGWTSIPEIGGIGVNYVTGIQGRYFIPIAIFIAMLFANRFIKTDLKGTVALKRVVVVAAPLFLTVMLFLLLARYWF